MDKTFVKNIQENPEVAKEQFYSALLKKLSERINDKKVEIAKSFR